MILLHRRKFIQFHLLGSLLLIATSIAASSLVSANRNLEVSKQVYVLKSGEKGNASLIHESLSNQIVSKKYQNVSQNPQAEEESTSDQPFEKPVKSDSNGIFHVTLIFNIYKAISPIILRIIFGIALDEIKMMVILKRPIGIGIAFVCNFIFMPLVSCLIYIFQLFLFSSRKFRFKLSICFCEPKSNYLFGWMFFAGNADDRLSLFSSGATRLMGVFSTCWIVVLDGNMELSVVMSIVITISFSIIRSRWIFAAGEILFNSNSSNGAFDHMELNLYVFYIIWTLCSTIIPLLIGLCIQNIYPQTKEYAVKLVKRAVFSYILLNFVIMTVHDIVGWIHSNASFTVSHKHIQPTILLK